MPYKFFSAWLVNHSWSWHNTTEFFFWEKLLNCCLFPTEHSKYIKKIKWFQNLKKQICYIFLVGQPPKIMKLVHFVFGSSCCFLPANAPCKSLMFQPVWPVLIISAKSFHISFFFPLNWSYFQWKQIFPSEFLYTFQILVLLIRTFEWGLFSVGSTLDTKSYPGLITYLPFFSMSWDKSINFTKLQFTH